MAEVTTCPPAGESAQVYMMNLMVDADDEDDVQIHLTALCGDFVGLLHLLHDPTTKQWINYRVRPYLSPPLRLAVSGGSVECVSALVDAGAEIDLEDVKGQTALFVATSQRKPEIMKVLLEGGANPDGSRKNRCTPLLVAVRDGFTMGVKLLLQYGCDPEPCEQIATCVPGWPLHHSVVYAHFPCFLELLRGGAAPSLASLPCQVNPKVLARLSIPHAVLKYARDQPEFIKLYHECGGNLRQPNLVGTTCDEEPEPSPAKDLLLTLIGSPMSLKSVCRLKVRGLLGSDNLALLSSFQIPASLITFLHFEEFSRYSIRSKDSEVSELIETSCNET